MAMKLFVGWAISAGVIAAATAAGAQTLPPQQNGVSRYSTVSDVGQPYAAMPPDSMSQRYAPPLLPPQEVYAVVRENGYAPLGAPHQRGFAYTIAVIDPNGDDGRLVIDARNGRIVRFMPAFRTGDEVALSYGAPGPQPPVTVFRGVPRPPASVPRVASRSPIGMAPPKAMPRAVAEPKPPAPLAATPAPAAAPVRQSAVEPPKPAEAMPPAAAAAPIAAKPPVHILPTQEMPKAQGLDY
jgi:hypothetical protein